jgi:hypothetical protein
MTKTVDSAGDKPSLMVYYVNGIGIRLSDEY